MRPIHAGSILAAGAFVLAAGSRPAEAAKLRFGSEETLTRYADTGIMSGGEKLSLCYKATTQWFVAGLYTTDEAVLCDKAQKRYWDLPKGDQLAQLQSRGLLPKPIPAYERPFLDYAFGYSLWVVGAVLGLGAAGSRLLAKGSGDKAMARHKMLVRRVMAETIDARSGFDAKAEAAALGVYERVFEEPLAAATFAADRQWITANPDTYRAYLAVTAKNTDPGIKTLLLRIATALTFELGRADEAGWRFLVDLASRLGLDEAAVQAVAAEMTTPPAEQQPSPSPPPRA